MLNSYLSEKDRRIVLALARESIQFGLKNNTCLPLDLESYPTPLTLLRATFVTLEISGRLRGCIGTLEAHRPLVIDIVENSYQAAFSDPRFSPLTEQEFEQLDVHLSILSLPQELQFSSEQALIAQLQPHIDGLIIQEGIHKGTFLPTVWNSIPEPRDFFYHLKQKAGLRPDYWSDQLKVFRYSTMIIE